MNKWHKFSEQLPPVDEVIYLMFKQTVFKAIVKHPADNIYDYDYLHCGDCGFVRFNTYLGEGINPITDNDCSWAIADRYKNREICACCNAEKWVHVCGADSHPGCIKYLSHLQQVKQPVPQNPDKRMRRMVLFYWFLGIFTVVLLSFLSGAGNVLSARIKKYLYDEVGAPLVKDLSHEVQDVVKVFNKDKK